LKLAPTPEFLCPAERWPRCRERDRLFDRLSSNFLQAMDWDPAQPPLWVPACAGTTEWEHGRASLTGGRG